MGRVNKTLASEFILLGLSSIPEVEVLVFIIFLLIYVTTLTGNILIITIIHLDANLHTAMYYFISNLSFLDSCFSTVTVPKMLVDYLLAEKKTISFSSCMIQLYFFVSLVSIECLLLATMAYDRYIAICHPLQYSSIMDERACSCLAAVLWVGGHIYSSVHVILMSRLSFCRSKEIQHFFCDIPPLLNLSCTDTFINILVIFTLGGFFGFGALLTKIVSYTFIIITILNIKSSEGRAKAFSTCASHLIVVSIFYASILFTYFRPTTNNSFYIDRFVSVVYTILTPMVNPMIYSLRNTEIKKAVKITIRILVVSRLRETGTNRKPKKSQPRETVPVNLIAFAHFLGALLYTLQPVAITLSLLQAGTTTNDSLAFLDLNIKEENGGLTTRRTAFLFLLFPGNVTTTYLEMKGGRKNSNHRERELTEAYLFLLFALFLE
ncbi:olfactory receptor 5V1-like [Lissotriton helveticus]